MPSGVEIERMIVRLVGDASAYHQMLSTAASSTRAGMSAINKGVVQTAKEVQATVNYMGAAITKQFSRSNFGNALTTSLAKFANVGGYAFVRPLTSLEQLKRLGAEAATQFARLRMEASSFGSAASRGISRTASSVAGIASQLGRLTSMFGRSKQQITSTFDAGSRSVSGFNSNLTLSTGQLVKMGLVVGAVQAALNAAFSMARSLGSAVFDAGKSSVLLAAEAEQVQMAFRVMMGSGELAAKMIKDIRTLAAKTPLESGELLHAARTLMQYGLSADRVIGTLRMLGDAAGGNRDQFARLSLAYAQTMAMGRLQGQDLLQMINAGFNPLQEIAKRTGKTMAQLKKEMEKGAISADMVTRAFYDATSAGGRFNGMMNEQSKTLTGKWSTLMDNIKNISRTAGDDIIEALNLKGIVSNLIAFTDMFAANYKANMTALSTWATQHWNLFMGFLEDRFGSFVNVGGDGWQYILDTLSNFGQRALGFMTNFTHNIGSLWVWLGENWSTLITDMFRAYGTYLQNSASNTLVYVNTLYRLFIAWSGWMKGVWEKLWTGELPMWVYDGLVAVGEMIRQFAKNAWDTLKSIFTGGGPADLLEADFVDKMFKDFDKGAANLNFGETAADIVKEEFSKLKAPFEGFQSQLTDMPDLKFDVNGEALPKFTWNKGQEAGGDMSAGFAAGLKNMSGGANKEMAKVDAVAYNSAAALHRLQAFQSTLPDSVRNKMTVTAGQEHSKDKLQERQAVALETLVRFETEKKQRNPDLQVVQLVEANL